MHNGSFDQRAYRIGIWSLSHDTYVSGFESIDGGPLIEREKSLCAIGTGRWLVLGVLISAPVRRTSLSTRPVPSSIRLRRPPHRRCRARSCFQAKVNLWVERSEAQPTVQYLGFYGETLYVVNARRCCSHLRNCLRVFAPVSTQIRLA